MKQRISYFIGILVIGLLSQCNAYTASAPHLTLGELLYHDSFDNADDWDAYNLQGLTIGIDDGVYRINTTLQAYVWGLNRISHEDIIIDVDARQLSDYRRNAYGLMCRASPQNNGNGYYFLVSADGYYSIRRGEGRAVNPLVEWEYSDVIVQNRGLNQLRVVCDGAYLALYVNGQFLASVEDGLYHYGFVGLVAALPNDDGEARITFDNLRAYASASSATEQKTQANDQ